MNKYEQCSCGSGRKYKFCCLDMSGLSARDQKTAHEYAQFNASILTSTGFWKSDIPKVSKEKLIAIVAIYKLYFKSVEVDNDSIVCRYPKEEN